MHPGLFLLQQGAQQGMHGGAGVAAAADYARRQAPSFYGAAESAVGRLSGTFSMLIARLSLSVPADTDGCGNHHLETVNANCL